MDIKEILEKRDKLQEQINKFDKLIEAYRAVCDHNWVCTGNTSHTDVYECSICKEYDSY